ncbi:unnamed protein product [Macrosiphum euphorbiae]|uniref:Uncharacterized protein n=1 Tax=Macrosiphum euphorbiae TaxID=13131 RepID=A0AAV0Y2Y9_9HEMI|nr:unnamed protein product [Macrosiphum euphorbiae]
MTIGETVVARLPGGETVAARCPSAKWWRRVGWRREGLAASRVAARRLGGESGSGENAWRRNGRGETVAAKRSRRGVLDP